MEPPANPGRFNTANIAYQSRHRSEGTVYVATSRSLGLVKIGGATDLNKRIQTLRNQSYAGASDWDVLVYAVVAEYGRVEKEIQDKLYAHKTTRHYWKDGSIQDATEVFACTYAEAKDAFDCVLSQGQS